MSIRPMFPHAAVVFALLAGAAICAALGETAYWFYVGEDGFAETLTVIFFALGFIYAVRTRVALSGSGDGLLNALFVVAAIGMLLLAGEEISWGQRFFGWSTPEKFQAVNVQGETTLHNLNGVHQSVQFAQILVGLYGVVLPFLVPRLSSGWLGNLLREIVPGVALVPYFLPLLGWRIVRLFWTIPPSHHYAIIQINEVLECILSVGFFLFFLHADRRARARRARPA